MYREHVFQDESKETFHFIVPWLGHDATKGSSQRISKSFSDFEEERCTAATCLQETKINKINLT